MAILEAILEELKLLNQNLSVANMEPSTTKESNIKRVLMRVLQYLKKRINRLKNLHAIM